MAFTGSAKQVLDLELDLVFKNKATVNPELTNVPVAGPNILMRQTSNATPLMEGDGPGTCVGAKVWYRTANNTTVPTISGSPVASVCDLTTGDEMDTASQVYGFNVFLKERIAVSDDDCDDLAKYLPNVAFLMSQKMSLFAQSINNYMIAQLEANKSVATLAGLPSSVTLNAGNYEIVGGWTSATAADQIKTLDEIAFQKGLPDNYYIVAGQALKIPQALAVDHAANDNERSYTITFSQRDVINDSRNLDTIIGAEVVFLIDPNCMVNYFYNKYDAIARETKDKNNTIEFSVPLTYYSGYQDANSNMSTMMYLNNGMPTEIRVDVSMQKVCLIGSNGFRTYKDVYEMGVVGLMDFVPAVGDNTGIIRVNKA